MRLNDSPQVEHVSPKTPVPARTLDWENMLLACGACNSRKNDELCNTATHLLPDAHDTHLAFGCQVLPHPKRPLEFAAIVVVRQGLSATALAKAQATIVMCGLDNIPVDRPGIDRASDLRWKYRYEEVLEANIWRAKWNAVSASGQLELLDCIRAIVKRGGFFSIWFDTFHDVPAVKEALINAFPNTAACFPAPTFDPIERIPGDL